MAIWSGALRWLGFKGLERNKGEQYPSPVYGSNPAANVNFDSAMQISAFWASSRLLSEAVAALPLKCYRMDGDVKQQDTSMKLWRVLNYQPNRYQTRNEFFETVMLNLVTTGNSYCAIERDSGNNVVSLLPLMSSQMEVNLLEDGEKVYEYTTENHNKRVYSERSVWHLKLFGNGLIGLSPLGYARKSLGIAIASDDRASKLAASGGKTNGMLTIDKVLTPEQREAVRKNFKGLTEGSQEQLFVLEAGMDFHRTSLSPQDMQLLETRKFQTEDIARFMGVPSVLINDTSGTTSWGSGIQQIMEGFYKLNLRPYLERIESSIKKNLMGVNQWEQYDIEFDFDALLRADMKTRAEARRAEINAGTLTPNEARREEGRPPMEGGDKIYLNGSLVAAGANNEQVQN